MAVIRPDDLKQAILKELKDYNFNVQLDMSTATKKRISEGVKMLKRNYGTKRTGEYNSGWKMKKARKGHMIYNAKKGELTHILEHGHATANGTGYVEGIPHISLVEKQIVANFEKDVEQIIQNAGR